MSSAFAVISDIHSNLLALQAVLHNLESEGIESIFCLGDVVGYGAEPNECVELIRKAALGRTIRGNHDIAAAIYDPYYWERFNPQAAEAVRFQQRMLTAENASWLISLPESIADMDCLFYHGSPLGPDHYLMSVGDLETALDAMDPGLPFRIMFVGHTHLPTAVGVGPDGGVEVDIRMKTKDMSNVTVFLDEDRRYLINPGSVGQPRDKNPRAAYVVVDFAAGEVRFRRIEYDVKETQRRIITAGLPEFLSLRLEYGV
jgi:diadenosine tetraphosphatase ApaH/serine/threonine PP2A family protein phosphatase